MKQNGVVITRVDGNPENDFALLCELYRVSDEIDDHLPQSSDIADQAVWNVGSYIEREFEALLVSAVSESSDGVRNTLSEPERRRIELEVPAFDLGEVQNVVDDVDERVR